MTITGTSVTTTPDGNVEISTHDRDGNHVVIVRSPGGAAALAVDIAGVATDAGAMPSLAIERQISNHSTIRFRETKRRNVRIDWTTGGRYNHQLTIHYGRLREIADKLHDFADIIAERNPL